MLWVSVIISLVSCAAGLLAGWRTPWRAMAVVGLVVAGLGCAAVVTLLGCIASGDWGPWFSLFPVFALGLVVAFPITLWLLAAAIVIFVRGRRATEASPRPWAHAALLAQMLVLPVQLALVLWMMGGHVPNV